MNHRRTSRAWTELEIDADRLRLMLDHERDPQHIPLRELRPHLAAAFQWSRARQDRALHELRRLWVVDFQIAQSPASLWVADREAGFWEEGTGFVAYVSVRADAPPREDP